LLGVLDFCLGFPDFARYCAVFLSVLGLCSVLSDFTWFYEILIGVMLFFPVFLVLGGPAKTRNTNLHSRLHSKFFGWSNQNSKPKYAITIRLYDVSSLTKMNKQKIETKIRLLILVSPSKTHNVKRTNEKPFCLGRPKRTTYNRAREENLCKKKYKNNRTRN
jgi:hypothetical protein